MDNNNQGKNRVFSLFSSFSFATEEILSKACRLKQHRDKLDHKRISDEEKRLAADLIVTVLFSG